MNSPSGGSHLPVFRGAFRVTSDMIKREQSRIYSSFAERECHRAKLNGRTKTIVNDMIKRVYNVQCFEERFNLSIGE